MFQGASVLTLDAKGQMSIPPRHRETLQLQAESRVTVIKHPDDYLMLFPRPEWERFRECIAVLPVETHWRRRILLGSAAGVELDTAGRVFITPELHAAVSLERDVVLPGIGSRFEVWDVATYTAKGQVATTQGMPDALKSFSF